MAFLVPTNIPSHNIVSDRAAVPIVGGHNICATVVERAIAREQNVEEHIIGAHNMPIMTDAAKEVVSEIVMSEIRAGRLKYDIMRGLICTVEEYDRKGSTEGLYERIITVVVEQSDAIMSERTQ